MKRIRTLANQFLDFVNGAGSQCGLLAHHPIHAMTTRRLPIAASVLRVVE